MKKGFRILKFKKDRPIFEVRELNKSFDGRPILKTLLKSLSWGVCRNIRAQWMWKTTLFSICIGELNIEKGKFI